MAAGSRRKIVQRCALALAILAIGGVLVTWAGSQRAQLGVAEPVASQSPRMPAQVSAPPPVAPEEPAGEDPVEQAEAPDHPAIRRYLELTRYADASRRIDEDSHDLLHPNRRYELRQRLPVAAEGDDPTYEVRFTADRYALRGDESAQVVFELWRAGEPVAPTRLELVAEALPAAATRAGSRSGEAVRLDVRRDGPARTALLTPDELWPDHFGKVRLTARFEAPGLGRTTGTLTFFFTPQSRVPATFTGGFADRLVQGDLVVDVGVAVRVAGTYRIEGNLFDRHGRPFAWARFQGELAPGVRQAPLVFDGLIFHDAAAEPPFVLRTLRGYRMRPGDSPHREDLRDFAGEYALEDRYVLADFRSDPRPSLKSREMVERYQDAIERGVRLGRPSGATLR